MNRGDKLFGIVVSPTDRFGEEKYVNEVFVLNPNGDHTLFHVLRDAFELQSVIPSGGNEFDIVADIKLQARKRQKYLDVGDWISWYYSGQDEILEFRREQRLHEMRCSNPNYQFLLDCIKSPTENVLYNCTFGYIRISPQEGKHLLPDIAIRAWIDVYIQNDKLIVEFSEFVTSTYQIQIMTVDTPWIEYHKVDDKVLTMLDEFDEDSLIVPANDEKREKKHNNVFGVLGFYVSEFSLYETESPEKVFLIPYVDEKLYIPGVQYRFDAYYHESKGVFIVSHAEKLPDYPTISTIGEAHDGILISDTVNQRPEYKCLFHTTKNNYGIMDDPTGALALHHLTRYADSKAKVYFYEDRNASFGRFRIEKVDLDKSKKIEKNIREAVTEVRGIKGVVVSSEGRVFSPSHPSIRIFLPSSLRLPIGIHIVFTAKINHDTKELEAIEDTLKIFEEQAPLEYIEYNGRLMFKTTAEWTTRADPVTGAVSTHFGLVDDPLRVLPEPYKKTSQMNVWVAESGMDEGGTRRVAQTPFFLVAYKKSIPTFTGTKLIDNAGRDVGGWIRMRDGTLKAMESQEREIKFVAGKFSKPKPRGDAGSCLSRPGTSLSSRPYQCGCPNGPCKAKRVIIKLMNDQKFRNLLHTKLPESTLDKVLACIL